MVNNNNRINYIVNHIKPDKEHDQAKLRDCTRCIYNNNCNGIIDIEDMNDVNKLQNNIILDHSFKAQLKDRLLNYDSGFGLPGYFYTNEDIFKAEMKYIYHKNWLFAGHTLQLPDIGDYITFNAGLCPIVIIRSNDGDIKAYHNVCRHRGLKLFDEEFGHIKTKNIKCLYHGWNYNTDNGDLVYAKEMEENDNFIKKDLGLFKVHVKIINTYIFINVSDTYSDDSEFFQNLKEYSDPYDLDNSKIAYESKIIEKANWKLVIDNNLDCAHCLWSHPELIVSFPEDWKQSDENELSQDENIKLMKKLNLPYKFKSAQDNESRFMRVFFVNKAESMTKDGKLAVKNGITMGRLPNDYNTGDVLWCKMGTCWNHYMADYALSFRVTPISYNETEVKTTWFVPKNAIKDVDYDLKHLTETWLATNNQDKYLVERAQKGMASISYKPGPFSNISEVGPIRFYTWYKNKLLNNL